MLLLIEIVMAAFALWLGLYLLLRNAADARLRLAGLGLLAYAAGLGLDVLLPYAGPPLAARLQALQRPFLLLPALCWLGLLLVLLPGDLPWRQRLARQRRPYAVILTATIFFGLGIGFLFWPLTAPWRAWLLPAIGVDLLLLGLSVAVLDAFAAGETLRPHLLRSLTTAAITSLLFGGQVALAMWLATGVTLPMLTLLLTTLAAAVTVQTLADPLQGWLDRLALPRLPQLRAARAAARAEADAAVRLDAALDPAQIDAAEFARLTRRALSHLGNLPRLASSPLTQLPQVSGRVAQNGQPAPTLARASALKLVLVDSIARLKPPGDEAFGSSDAWRHYNALYFPYVVGLRPYSRRASHDQLDDAARQAMDWFRRDVPQRTLYNWQNAAAALIAQDLHDRAVHPPNS